MFKEAVLDRYESVAPILEFGVAIMLVFLGLQVFWNLKKGRLLHSHQHEHDDGPHLHIHGTHSPEEAPERANGPPQAGEAAASRVNPAVGCAGK